MTSQALTRSTVRGVSFAAQWQNVTATRAGWLVAVPGRHRDTSPRQGDLLHATAPM